ncbi:MAG: O-antigen ligase family protein, partial [Rhodothermales bacterium]
SGQSFPIIFGDLTLAGAYFSALSYLPLREDFPRLALPASLLGFLGGMAASFLSGTRGSWLAIPVLTVLLVWFYWRRSGLRRTAAVSFVVVLVVALGILFPADHVLGRIGQAFTELSRYQAARAAVARVGPQAGCLTDREFLASLASHLSLAGAKDARVDVVAVQDKRTIQLQGQTCQPRYALRFSNHDVKRSAWLLLRRNLAPTLPSATVRLLVMGRGLVKPVIGHIRAKKFNSGALQELSIGSVPSAANILLRVGPGNSIVFIPVATTKGEYFFWYADTSVGARLEMWRAAWQLFVRHPLLGVGTGGFRHAISRLTSDGEIAPVVARFDHPHNEYLAQLSSRGLVGFGTLVVLFWFMAVDCRRGLRSPLDEYAAASACGLVLIAGYGIFGLTETIFTHSLAIAFFVFYVAFFLAVIQVESSGSVEFKNILNGDESNDR